MSYLEWAESQLAEIELLTSMFPTQEELEMTDQLALAELRGYVECSDSTDRPPPSRPQFLIKQKLDSSSMERVTKYSTVTVCHCDFKYVLNLLFVLSCCFTQMDVILSCAYPSEYPSVLPEITVR